MTAVQDAAITAHRCKRLAARGRLLEDLHEATTAERQAHARARIALRRDQIADAKTVLARHRAPQLTARERAVRAAMLGYRHRDAIHCTQDTVRRWEGIATQMRSFEQQNAPQTRGFVKYRYGDSNPGFRRERAAS